MEDVCGLLHHETIVSVEDMRKICEKKGKNYDKMQEHEVSELLDLVIDEMIQNFIK